MLCCHGTVEVPLNPSYPITLGGWHRLWVIRGCSLRGTNLGVNLVFEAARNMGYEGVWVTRLRGPGMIGPEGSTVTLRKSVGVCTSLPIV